MKPEFQTLSAIIAELQRLCSERRTGAFFISTENNSLVQISLENGEIVYVAFRNKRGAEALALLLSIKSGKTRFHEGPIATFRSALPPTQTLLNWLSGNKSTDPGPVQAQKPSANDAAGAAVSASAKAVIEKTLAKYIGPAAAFVCARVFRSSVDLNAAVDTLAGKIPATEDAVKFKQQIAQKLQTE